MNVYSKFFFSILTAFPPLTKHVIIILRLFCKNYNCLQKNKSGHGGKAPIFFSIS